MMKKIICLVLLSAAAAVVTGCGGKNEAVENSGVTIVKIMKPGSISDFYDVLSDFTEENPDIRVKFVDAPTGTLERHGLYVSAMAERDSSVDIYWLNDEWTDEFAKYGYIRPFESDFEISHEQNITDTQNAFEYENRLYAMPIGVDTDILYYRNDTVASPPQDWNIPINENSISINCRDSADMIYNIIGIKRSMKVSFTETLKMYKQLIDGMDIENGDAAAVFKNGKKAMYFGKASDYGGMNSSVSAIRGGFSIAPIPADKAAGHFVRNYGLGINSNSENTDAALKVIDYLKREDVQRLLARSCSLMPVIRSLYDDEMVLYDNAHFKNLKNIAETADSYASLGVDNERIVRLSDALNMYLAGNINEETAGAVFEEELN